MSNNRYRWDVLRESIRSRISVLKQKLGGQCKQCGETDFNKLEFHHHQGKAYDSNRLSRTQRIRRYEQEAEEGLIVLLCKNCHQVKLSHGESCFCPFCRGEQESDF